MQGAILAEARHFAWWTEGEPGIRLIGLRGEFTGADEFTLTARFAILHTRSGPSDSRIGSQIASGMGRILQAIDGGACKASEEY